MDNDLKFYIGEYEGVTNKSIRILRTSIEQILNNVQNKISEGDSGFLIVSEIDIFTGVKKYLKKYLIFNELNLIKEESIIHTPINKNDITKEILVKMK